jgi:hypothetical protein
MKRIQYSKILNCPISNCQFKSNKLKRLDSLIKHLAIVHNLKDKEAFAVFHNISIEKSCECGCNGFTEWRGWSYGFPRFLHGHNASIIETHWTKKEKNFLIVKNSRIKALVTRKNKKVKTKNEYFWLEKRKKHFLKRSEKKFGKFHFDLSVDLKNYKNHSTPIKIKCLICNKIFETTPQIHLNTISGGCKECYMNNVMNSPIHLLSKINEIHKNKIIWKCPERTWIHKLIEFECVKCKLQYRKSLNNTITKKQGCPRCRQSRASKKEIAWLDELGISLNDRQKQIITKDGNRYWVDAFVDNVVYEYYGSWWHGDPRLPQREAIFDITGFTADFLYEKTIKREDEIRRSGFEVKSIWELDLDSRKKENCFNIR